MLALSARGSIPAEMGKGHYRRWCAKGKTVGLRCPRQGGRKYLQPWLAPWPPKRQSPQQPEIAVGFRLSGAAQGAHLVLFVAAVEPQVAVGELVGVQTLHVAIGEADVEALVVPALGQGRCAGTEQGGR